MDNQSVQEASVTEIKSGKTSFGINQLNNPTPMWVTWVFRTEFLINKAFGIWMASQNILSVDELKQWVLWTTIIDGFVWGIGKFVGIKKEDLDK